MDHSMGGCGVGERMDSESIVSTAVRACFDFLELTSDLHRVFSSYLLLASPFLLLVSSAAEGARRAPELSQPGPFSPRGARRAAAARRRGGHLAQLRPRRLAPRRARLQLLDY
jgi:hypothetical protein